MRNNLFRYVGFFDLTEKVAYTMSVLIFPDIKYYGM